MRSYQWDKELHELGTSDVVKFRSWLLKTYSRDHAKKVLSAFHSVILEMITQGVLTTDPAAKISIQESRYRERAKIPSVEDIQDILRAADRLANHKNGSISKAWERYRPMIYLAADSGMRPQEYLVLPTKDVLTKGVRISQALDRSNKIGPPKSAAGRRYIPIGQDTLDMVRHFVKVNNGPNVKGIVFSGRTGSHQTYTNFRRRCWCVLLEEAGLLEHESSDQAPLPKYSPYSLRHFYASMLIAQNKDLKTIQERMGHVDAAMTLNVYGHLIRLRQAEEIDDPSSVVSDVLKVSCGKSVAEISQGTDFIDI